MLSESYIFQQFQHRPPAEQVDLLLQALDHMKTDSDRSKAECIALALGLPLFPKVARLDEITEYNIKLTFDNGEARLIDFRTFFNPARRLERALLEDYDKFAAVEVQDGTLVWPSVGIESTDAAGQPVVYPYDVDPGLLYEAGRAVVEQ